MLAALVALAAGIGAGLGMMSRDQVSLPVATSTATASAPVEQIEVHVAGWVHQPGVVNVFAGAIVADAIEAAGGLRPGAEATAVNLAAPVAAGQQIVVPGPGAEMAPGASTGGGVVSLNQADAAILETLPGVGPVLADRIVAFRADHGPFQSVDDLLEVPGIGEAKLASIRDLVRP